MIRRAMTAAAAAASVLAFPLAARAQEGSSESRVTAEDRGRTSMFAFSDCVMRRSPEKAAVYLAMRADDPASTPALHKLITSDCLSEGALTMPDPLLRGSLFRTAYMQRFYRVPATLGSVAVDFASYVGDPKSAVATRYRVLMDFADCVVRKDPVDSDRFVRAQAGSAVEKDALAKLMPILGPCMSAGLSVKLNRSVINAVLSEALFREASFAPQGGAAGRR